jgi:hypothetical protein
MKARADMFGIEQKQCHLLIHGLREIHFFRCFPDNKFTL